jgi:hypothetical protein
MVSGSERRAMTSMASWILCGSSDQEEGGCLCLDRRRGMMKEEFDFDLVFK